MSADRSGGWRGVVVTCEGDLHDADFPARLRHLLRHLRRLVFTSEHRQSRLKLDKVSTDESTPNATPPKFTFVNVRSFVFQVEPWNSVRITLSVPMAAALRLRALAAAGAPQLRALGVLSVQLDGDRALSLRLATPSTSQQSSGNVFSPTTITYSSLV